MMVRSVMLALAAVSLGPVAACTASEVPRHRCPGAGGTVVPVSEVEDVRGRPSLNLAVWNRSSCGPNLMYDFVCTDCWFAHHAGLHFWSRALADKRDFRPALDDGIAAFPLPDDATGRVVYSRKQDGTSIVDEVAFWCSSDPAFLASAREHAVKHGLTLALEEHRESHAGKTYLRANTR